MPGIAGSSSVCFLTFLTFLRDSAALFGVRPSMNRWRHSEHGNPVSPDAVRGQMQREVRRGRYAPFSGVGRGTSPGRRPALSVAGTDVCVQLAVWVRPVGGSGRSGRSLWPWHGVAPFVGAKRPTCCQTQRRPPHLGCEPSHPARPRLVPCSPPPRASRLPSSVRQLLDTLSTMASSHGPEYTLQPRKNERASKPPRRHGRKKERFPRQ